MGSRQPRQYADLSKPRTQWNLRVELPQDGMRLDRFLADRVEWRSRSQLQQMVDDGQVTVNDALRKSSTRLHNGDRVVVQIPQPDVPVDPATIPIDVLIEDQHLIAINKRPGIVVHPTSGHTLTNVLSALHARYRNTAEPAKDRVPHICHRIDKETSGVLLFAFSEKIKADVSLQFEARTVKKEYLALVHGDLSPAEGVIDAPILHRRTDWPRLIVDPTGLPSRTAYRVEEGFGTCSLVRFFPLTGRTHQIRVHSAHVGHPLLADETYGGTRPVHAVDLAPTSGEPPEQSVVLERVALHSTRLEIRHPVTGEQVAYEAPLPADLQSVLAFLRERR